MNLDTIKNQAAEQEIQMIRGEHHIAELVQRSMLPNNAEAIMADFPVEIFADMDTAWEIGGDFYDYMVIDENQLFFAIADISGKSISAALFSEITRTAMETLLMSGHDLAQTCLQVSKYLYNRQHSRSHMFATMWGGILDVRSGICSFINAGHEPPLLLKVSGETHFIEAVSCLPLGSYYNKANRASNECVVHTLKMEKGDSILLYTDGVTESANYLGERLGRSAIIDLTKRCRAQTLPVKEWVSIIQRHVVSHINHADQDDDITLFGLRYLA